MSEFGLSPTEEVARQRPTPSQGLLSMAQSATLAERLPLLDDEDEWAAFSRPVPERAGCWESSVVFDGMHCAACALTIEEQLMHVPGVQSVQVSAASQRARVVWSAAQTKPSTWMAAARQSGYMAAPANDAELAERRRQEARTMVWRWGVAGLCMMQVMMYAWPVYVAEPGSMGRNIELLLRWACWVLSVPVLFFSCTPFFTNAWRDLRLRQVSMDLPVALGMLIAFGASTIGTFDPDGVLGKEVYFDSFTMFVFFLLTGRWLEVRLRERTAGALEALLNRLPDGVSRRNKLGVFERVPLRRLKVGDRIEVHPGEAFAGDGTVLTGHTTVDEALLTGESMPLPRDVGDAVIAGSHNLSGVVEVKIERLGGDTRFSQIVGLMENAAMSRPRVAQLADRVAKPFLIGVIIASVAAGLYWWQSGLSHALMVVVAVLVVTCPCALSLATPAAMLTSAGALARRGVLARRLESLESLSQVDTVVFDKTGTLTQDLFALRRTATREGLSPERALQLAAALATKSLHPVSRALVLAAGELSNTGGDDRAQAAGVQEWPGQGVQADTVVWQGETWHDLHLGSPAFCGLDQAPQAVGLALRSCLSDANGWLATFELDEHLRPDAQASVQQLQAMGLDVRILSGDGHEAVARLAEQLGVRHAQGGCTPDDKLQALRALQGQGRKVAMVGDGLNDGPTLAGAQAAFAFGRAVPLAQAQSDFVVLGQELARIPQTLLLSRRTMQVVRQNLVWAALYNAICVPLAMAGWLPAWLAGLGMAVSSLVVVLNALRLSGELPNGAEMPPKKLQMAEAV